MKLLQGPEAENAEWLVMFNWAGVSPLCLSGPLGWLGIPVAQEQPQEQQLSMAAKGGSSWATSDQTLLAQGNQDANAAK